jgi:hypothetical protein
MIEQQEVLQVEHPDRVVWYQSLIEEWACQTPGVEQLQSGEIAAWVGPYTSQAGMCRPGPTQVIALTVESALEALANTLYADYQQDLAMLRYLSANTIATYASAQVR